MTLAEEEGASNDDGPAYPRLDGIRVEQEHAMIIGTQMAPLKDSSGSGRLSVYNEIRIETEAFDVKLYA